jgi:hypothetical protein
MVVPRSCRALTRFPAERLCLNFLVLAKAGGFLEPPDVVVKSLVDAPPNSRLLTVPCIPQSGSNINGGARMDRETPCERAPRLPAGDRRTV